MTEETDEEKTERLDREGKALFVHEYDQKTGELIEEPMDLSGDITCGGCCEYHDEPCVVVLHYNDDRINNMVKHLHSIQGTEPHNNESRHYCELCQLATRQGFPKSVFYRMKKGANKGLIYKGKPRPVTYDEFYDS